MLGGAICGSLIGIVGGAACGVFYGLLVADISAGLDGALLGAALMACAGAIYGAFLGPDHKAHPPLASAINSTQPAKDALTRIAQTGYPAGTQDDMDDRRCLCRDAEFHSGISLRRASRTSSRRLLREVTHALRDFLFPAQG